MSWEGYSQNLCVNGHQFVSDPKDEYYYEDHILPPVLCPICNAPRIWSHLVDETNGYDADNQATYPVSLETKTEAVMCNCNNCGHTHEIRPATYHTPKEGEQ